MLLAAAANQSFSHSLTKKPLSQVKVVFWDIDGTVYPYDPALVQACHDAAGAVALQLIRDHDLDLETAIKLSHDSYHRTGYFHDVFVERYNADRDALHLLYHQILDSSFITACHEGRKMLQRSPLKHFGLTHASRYWGENALERKTWRPFFHSVAGSEDYGYDRKDTSFRTYAYYLERLGFKPEEAIVFEDTPKNLIHPYLNGMHTVLVHRKREPGMDYVGHEATDALAALDFLESYIHPWTAPAYNLAFENSQYTGVQSVIP